MGEQEPIKIIKTPEEIDSNSGETGQKQPDRRGTPARIPAMTGDSVSQKVSEIKNEISRIEQEKALIEKILQNSGSVIHISVPANLETQEIGQRERSGGGFQNLTKHYRQYRSSGQGIGATLPSQEIINEHRIVEIIDIRHAIRTQYIREEVVDKKGFWGMGRRVHTEIIVKNERMSYGKITGRTDRDEPAIKLTYSITKPIIKNGPDKYDWRDYTNRSGQTMIAEIILPESMAEEIEKAVNNNPAVIRQIIERIMKEQILKNPEEWGKQRAHGESSLRPPWERWDAEGGQIYIQSENLKGFDLSQLRRANQ